IWMQFGLTLMESRKCPERALTVFKEVMRFDKNEVMACLMGAKLCITELDKPEEALELAIEGKKRSGDAKPLLARSHLLIGIAHALLYEQQPESVKKLRRKNLEQSMRHFHSALACISGDHLP